MSIELEQAEQLCAALLEKARADAAVIEAEATLRAGAMLVEAADPAPALGRSPGFAFRP